MGIFDLFGKKSVTESSNLYAIDVEVHPYRLRAGTNDAVDAEISVRNTFSTELLTSVVITVPKGLGFEQSTLSQQREIRIGPMGPGESKRFNIKIWSTQRTDKGDYPVKIYAISHYRNYAYVLNEVKKVITLRAV